VFIIKANSQVYQLGTQEGLASTLAFCACRCSPLGEEPTEVAGKSFVFTSFITDATLSYISGSTDEAFG